MKLFIILYKVQQYGIKKMKIYGFLTVQNNIYQKFFLEPQKKITLIKEIPKLFLNLLYA